MFSTLIIFFYWPLLYCRVNLNVYLEKRKTEKIELNWPLVCRSVAWCRSRHMHEIHFSDLHERFLIVGRLYSKTEASKPVLHETRGKQQLELSLLGSMVVQWLAPLSVCSGFLPRSKCIVSAPWWTGDLGSQLNFSRDTLQSPYDPANDKLWLMRTRINE